jgi:hypothetical protein
MFSWFNRPLIAAVSLITMMNGENTKCAYSYLLQQFAALHLILRRISLSKLLIVDYTIKNPKKVKK